MINNKVIINTSIYELGAGFNLKNRVSPACLSAEVPGIVAARLNVHSSSGPEVTMNHRASLSRILSFYHTFHDVS